VFNSDRIELCDQTFDRRSLSSRNKATKRHNIAIEARCQRPLQNQLSRSPLLPLRLGKPVRETKRNGSSVGREPGGRPSELASGEGGRAARVQSTDEVANPTLAAGFRRRYRSDGCPLAKGSGTIAGVRAHAVARSLSSQSENTEEETREHSLASGHARGDSGNEYTHGSGRLKRAKSRVLPND